MSDLWLPPGARRFPPHVEEVIESSPEPALARKMAEELREQGLSFATDETFGASITGPDSTSIVFPRAWGHVTTEEGRRLMAAFVEDAALERMILDATLEYEGAGIILEADHVLIQALCPALHVKLKPFQIVVPLKHEEAPCPFDWMTEALPGFALAIYKETAEDNKVPYVATGPLSPAHGLILPPRQGKIGRNDRCPCGSGVKYKKCCGR